MKIEKMRIGIQGNDLPEPCKETIGKILLPAKSITSLKDIIYVVENQEMYTKSEIEEKIKEIIYHFCKKQKEMISNLDGLDSKLVDKILLTQYPTIS